MIFRLLTGLRAKTWAIIAGLAGGVWAGFQLVAFTNAKRDMDEKESEDETRNRMDKVKPADSRADALDSLRERDQHD